MNNNVRLFAVSSVLLSAHHSVIYFALRYGAAQALRRKAGNGFYSSNCIVGQDVSLVDYCDAMAEAGVLVCEPGTFSYGLGALVLGRVIEVRVS